jgi:hypothetical protein
MRGHDDALLDAVITALEAEAAQPDPRKRLVILRTTRSILEAWKEQRATTEEAISKLLGVWRAEASDDAFEPAAPDLEGLGTKGA